MDFKRPSLPLRHCFCKLEEAATTSSCFATTRRETFPAQEGFPHESAASREKERERGETERELEQGASDVESEKAGNGASGSRTPRERSCPLKKKLLPARTSLPCPIHATGLGPVRPDPIRSDPTRPDPVPGYYRPIALQIGTPSLPKVFQKLENVVYKMYS